MCPESGGRKAPPHAPSGTLPDLEPIAIPGPPLYLLSRRAAGPGFRHTSGRAGSKPNHPLPASETCA